MGRGVLRASVLSLDLGQLLERLLDAGVSLLGGAGAGGGLAAQRRGGILLQFAPQGADLVRGLPQKLLQPLTAPEGSGSGTGSHAHAILRTRVRVTRPSAINVATLRVSNVSRTSTWATRKAASVW